MKIVITLLRFLASMLAEIAVSILKTPAIEEKTYVSEGNAVPLNDSAYDGLYGVRNRSEGTENVGDGKPSTDS